MRIGIAQLNNTVGDLEGNLALSIDAYEQLCGQGIDIAVYPELFLSGYPPRDLLLKESFYDVHAHLTKFSQEIGSTPDLLDFPKAVIDSQILQSALIQLRGVRTAKSNKSSGKDYFQLMMFLMKTDIFKQEIYP